MRPFLGYVRVSSRAERPTGRGAKRGIFVLTLLLWTGLEASEHHQPTDLGTLGDPEDTSVPRDINEGGDIVGYSIVDGVSLPFLVRSRGHDRFEMIHFGSLDPSLDNVPRTAPYSMAMGVNNQGDIVGHDAVIVGGSLATHGFFWTEDAGMVDLGTLPGHRHSQAMAINNRRLVVGWSGPTFGRQTPVVWQRDRARTWNTSQLPCHQAYGCVPLSVNESGLAVGYHWVLDGLERGCVWTQPENGTEWELTVLEPFGEFTVSLAFDINRHGHIAGSVGTTRQVGNQLRWDWVPAAWLRVGETEWEGFVLQTLTTPPGSGNHLEMAHGINDRGEVVGHVYGPDNAFRGCSWLISEPDADPEIFDLPGHGMGWRINNAGDVAGWSDDPDTGLPFHAYLIPIDRRSPNARGGD